MGARGTKRVLTIDLADERQTGKGHWLAKKPRSSKVVRPRPFDRQAVCPTCGTRYAVDRRGLLAWHGRWSPAEERQIRCPQRTVPADQITDRPLAGPLP